MFVTVEKITPKTKKDISLDPLSLITLHKNENLARRNLCTGAFNRSGRYLEEAIQLIIQSDLETEPVYSEGMEAITLLPRNY